MATLGNMLEMQAQCDLCVIAVIFNEEPLAVFINVGIRHKIFPLITFLTLRAATVSLSLPPSKELFTKAVPGLADLVTFREYQVSDHELS